MSAYPGVRFLPNAITVLALSTGLTSVVFALQGQWMNAMICIGAAAVLDSLDGPAARLLNSASRVGAELDSLSDLSGFGICPAVLLYIWQTKVHSGLGVTEYSWLVWASCLVYAVCTALRLARFNSLLEDEDPKPFTKGFFTGVPSPPGALLAMAPILAYVQFGPSFFSQIWVVAAWTVLVGLTMVSRIPTIALKSLRVSPAYFVPLLVLMVVAVVFLFFEPQLTTLVGLLAYLLHLPYSSYRYRYLAANPQLWQEKSSTRSTRPSGRRMRLNVRVPRRARVAGRLPDGTPALPVEKRARAGGRRRLR
ncbi:phosphatidylcholine/phosphatidylserine synthase [Nakamurella antarctica]|uniref:Phosphatidylcholine/phosphatidylserine synthase n=1 Tax=Nakamurella antarctica TaxID=1902245 RepID=A0A3G8ZJ60_9ACTN|nr:phosphatidylcholine/phosphatidylserine synthase [Nakamurella antarctica]AZI57238.1 phosphatidylcholine/phosphatidylserine synthase [Nakamurella antarctica]